jgi:hypothetical protein
MTGKLILSVLLLVVVACPRSTNSQSIENAAIEREEYAVYSAVISKLYLKKGVRLVVLTTPTCCEVTHDIRTEAPVYFKQFTPPEPAPLDETLTSYVERNEKPVDLRRSLGLKIKYKIVPYKGIDELFDGVELEEDWKTFYRMFPHSNGYMRFSRVGFNLTRDEAFVTTGWMCGSRCGEGRYILLRKKNRIWRVESSVLRWVS